MEFDENAPIDDRNIIQGYERGIRRGDERSIGIARLRSPPLEIPQFKTPLPETSGYQKRRTKTREKRLSKRIFSKSARNLGTRQEMIYKADYIFPIEENLSKMDMWRLTMRELSSPTVLWILLIQLKEKAKYLEGILLPGFTNAHCHVELSHMKGLFRQNTGMDGFIQQINALRLTVSREERVAALSEQMEQMYADGISVMADISNCDESFECKASSPIFTAPILRVRHGAGAPQIVAGALTATEG